MRRNEEGRLSEGRSKVGDDRSENRYHNDRQPQDDHQAIQERPYAFPKRRHYLSSPEFRPRCRRRVRGETDRSAHEIHDCGEGGEADNSRHNHKGQRHNVWCSIHA